MLAVSALAFITLMVAVLGELASLRLISKLKLSSDRSSASSPPTISETLRPHWRTPASSATGSP